MKRLPFIFAAVHAALTLWIFGEAIASPERSGLLPLIMYCLDYPCSIFMNWVRHLLHPDWGVRSNLAVDLTVFLIIGSFWFYAIGLVVKSALARVIHDR